MKPAHQMTIDCGYHSIRQNKPHHSFSYKKINQKCKGTRTSTCEASSNYLFTIEWVTFSLEVTGIIKQPLAEWVLKLKFSWPDSWLFHLVPGSSRPRGQNRLPLITNSGKSPPQACFGTCHQCFLCHLKFVCVLGKGKPASRYLNCM